MWTRQALHEFIKNEMANIKFVAVSNRQPYTHARMGGDVVCIQPASGLVTAIDPIMRASGGTWVAHASGSADRETADALGRIAVPPDNPFYTLRRVWVDEKTEEEYYYGLANEGLWPLCHIAFHRPVFRPQDWESYRRANQVFADAVMAEVRAEPAVIFIQDYHLALLPRMLKSRNPNLLVAQFWHIPWPNRETFRAFPWKEELLEGLLSNDLLGFHLRYHCSNFLDTVERTIEALIDNEQYSVSRGGRKTLVRPFPISIDFESHAAAAASREVELEMARWVADLGGKPEFLGIGIDRIDYTKGILERLSAIDHFLERNSRYHGRFVFLQIGVPSRTAIASYERLNRELIAQVEALNAKWDWKPVRLRRAHFGQVSMMALHRLGDVCMVTSLHDGMNLVAKEFVSSRFDEDGVLILSRFTGSARELSDALLVNPFSREEIAGAIETALAMPEEERKRRMRRMRATVEHNNVYRWAGKILTALLNVHLPEHEGDQGADDIPRQPIRPEKSSKIARATVSGRSSRRPPCRL
jgi:trehalose 6-phosphate synthase